MSTQTHERAVPALTIGWRIKMALAFGDVSREEMAEHLGVNKGTLTRWSSDIGAPPKRAYLAQIALRTGVDLGWLETGDEPADGDDPEGGGTLDTRRYIVPLLAAA